MPTKDDGAIGGQQRGALRTLMISDISMPTVPFGGGMRFATTARALAELGSVDLLLLRNDGMASAAPTVFSRIHAYRPDPTGGSVARRIRSDRRRILAQLPDWVYEQRYDLVWYNRERNWLRVRGAIMAPSIVDIDDLEEVLLRRWIDVGQDQGGQPLSMLDRIRLRRDARWWTVRHRDTARESQLLIFTSHRDRRTLGYANAMVVPNTYEPQPGQYEPAYPDQRPTILFPALLDWPPNVDAAEWLVREIAPRIRLRVPDLRVVLAGKASDRAAALAAPPGVEVTGQVPAMAPYLRSAHLVAVPLRVGGGTRIKILEAFAHRIPVVSTSIGAEGLDATPDVHLALADAPGDFAEWCIRLLTDVATGERLAAAGHALYLREYRPERAVRQVHAAVRMALKQQGPVRNRFSVR